MICSCPHHTHLNWRLFNAESRKRAHSSFVGRLTVAGALTAGLYAQRGGQNAAPQAAGPRPSTAPPLVPVRLNVDGNFRIAPPYAADPAFTRKPDVPKGRVIRFTMNSAESKLFPTAPAGRGAGGSRPRRDNAAVPAEPPQHQTFPTTSRGLRAGRLRRQHAGSLHRRPGRTLVRSGRRAGGTRRQAANRPPVHAGHARQPDSREAHPGRSWPSCSLPGLAASARSSTTRCPIVT